MMKLWQKCNLNLESFFIVSDNLEFQIENPLLKKNRREQQKQNKSKTTTKTKQRCLEFDFSK